MTVELAARERASAPLRGLPITECTLPALLNRQADAFGSKTLLEIDGSSYTYIQVRDRAAMTAAVLEQAGIRSGDRVATLAGNRLELLETILGATWMGAVAVPLNAELRGEQLLHALANSGARILVIEPALLKRLQEITLPSTLERVWSLGSPSAEPVSALRVERFPALSGARPAAPVAPGDTAALLYTSGTTGVSKGVCCPHAQFYWWGVNVSEQLGITEKDVLYTCLPLFHTNALNTFVQALVSGATFVVGRRFSASRFWQEVTESGATVTYLLGAMINILWSREPGPFDRAHRVRIALSPATPATLFEPFRQRFGFDLSDGFGSTETNAAINSAPEAPRAGYLGRVQPDFDAIVVDEYDVEVPDGTPGELLLRSRVPFGFATGYFTMPDKTVEAWQNLWFHTGDRVVREPDGWFRFVDRLKDVIRRRGENISSFEVEQVLCLHPGVKTAAAFPVASDMAEDEVMVSVVPKEGYELHPADIVAHCSDRLAKFAVPRFVDIVAELPRTANGKIRKAELRERGRTDTTWDREHIHDR